MTSTMRVNAANTARTKPTTGDTKMSFVNTDHLGWLICKNDDPAHPELPRALDTTTYNLLFQVIGYTFGGSGNTFHLPHTAGRVMGSTGLVTDSENRTRTYTAGNKVGELDHKLTVPEMPAHNHNKAAASPGINTVADGTTSVEANHTHGITDPGHFHTYSDTPNNQSVHTISTQDSAADNYRNTANTSSSTTGISVNPAGSHSHIISSNGGNQYHNNIQPTLFYGNTFIYSGIPMLGNFPFKTGLAPVLI
jgi:microcystin-dependent protein